MALFRCGGNLGADFLEDDQYLFLSNVDNTQVVGTYTVGTGVTFPSMSSGCMAYVVNVKKHTSITLGGGSAYSTFYGLSGGTLTKVASGGGAHTVDVTNYDYILSVDQASGSRGFTVVA